MQRLLLVAGLLAAPASGLSAASTARLFLRSHVASPPKADELAELKTENPEAYAIVKALLTKRSLGLLNPHHPTASFAAPAQQQEEEPANGPEVYEKFAAPGELRASHSASLAAKATKVDLPYAEVQPAAHRDWLNWKPDSAMSDEQMVQNVLGAVAELKGGKKAGLLAKRQSSDNALAADEDAFAAEAPKAEAPKPQAPAPQAQSHENSYLKEIDFGLRAAEKPAAPAPHENSYLKGLDLSGDMPKVVDSSDKPKKTALAEDSSANLLTSFSWDDSKPKEEAPKPKVAEKPETQSKDSTLLSWLGVVKKAPTPKAPAAPVKPSNPYLMDLS